jgi:predicted transcriptional regulator
VERQIIETIDAPRTDAALGEHAKVLDLSIAGMTAREIAKELGWGETKQAERKAVAAQDAALQALAGLEEKMAA